MNKKAILLIILLLNLPETVFADIYKWTDEQGITHLTNNKQDIPKEYQNNTEEPLKKTEKIQTKDGYIEIIETQNSFELTQYIRDNEAPSGYIKTVCHENYTGKMDLICKDLYNKIINQTEKTETKIKKY